MAAVQYMSLMKMVQALKKKAISMNITYTTKGNTITITKELLGQKQSEDYIYELELKKLKLTRNSNTIEFDKQ